MILMQLFPNNTLTYGTRSTKCLLFQNSSHIPVHSSDTTLSVTFLATSGVQLVVLLSDWVNRVLVKSNFQLDFGSFAPDFRCNFEI